MDGIRLGKIQQVGLVQHDVAKAVPFYRDGLGLPLQFEMAGMAFFDAGGVPFDDEPHLVGKTGTHEIWMCFCRDPERNMIGIAEQRIKGEG